MGTFYDAITDEQAKLIRRAPLFFVATADPRLSPGSNGAGPVNLSPRGGVPLHILTPNRVTFLDFVGSGNETARHSLAGGPITVMVCSFEDKDAAIIRLFGRARVMPVDESPIADLMIQDAGNEPRDSLRQAIEIDVDKTATSCGYGVPVMSFVRERQVADRGEKYK
jgi:hypothetical protein